MKVFLAMFPSIHLLAVSEASETTYDIFWLWTLLAAVGLAIIHIYSGKLLFMQEIPRNRWLSFGSGISVAYVFVHVLPELEKGQRQFETVQKFNLQFLENHVYVMALIGITVFYGLEKLAVSSRQQNQKEGEGDVTDQGVFWIHTISFATYNALIGYLLTHREEVGLWNLLLFFIAIGFHFLVNDYGLREHHKHQYDRQGRWILSGTVVFGWVLGQFSEIAEVIISGLFAFLAGGIVLNVIKEELPEERRSRFFSFLIGAVLYTILMLILETV